MRFTFELMAAVATSPTLQPTPRVRVAIAGGGLGGMALARALCQTPGT